jgi:DnaJ-class molecular chaperone
MVYLKCDSCQGKGHISGKACSKCTGMGRVDTILKPMTGKPKKRKLR